MISLLKKWLKGPPGASDVTEEQGMWLISHLGSMYRLALQRSSVEQAIAKRTRWASICELMEEAGLSCRALASGELTTETLSAGLGVILGEAGPMLLLRKEEAGYWVLPYMVEKPELREALPPSVKVYQFKRVIETEGKSESFGWKWFSKEFFADKHIIRDVLIGSLFIQLVGLAFPLASQAIVDKVITNQAVSTLLVLGVGILMMSGLSAVLSWIRQYFLLKLSNQLDTRLSQRVLTHLFRLPIQFFEHRATGNIINRIHVIEPVREFVAGSFMLAAIDIPFMFIFLVLMVSYSVSLSAVVAAFLSVMLITSFLVGPKLREYAAKNFQLGAKVQGFVTEQVAATETVKSLQLESSVERRFSAMNQEYLNTSLQLRELGNRYSTFMNWMEQTMNGVVLCLGAYFAMKGDGLTIGMLVAFQQFAQRVAQPLLKVAGLWQQFQQIRISVAQLGEMMSITPERYSPIKTSLTPAGGRLQVEGLGFRYGPQSPLLYNELSFEVTPGEVVLVTGPSGSGKSTLTKIIQGLYQQTSGVVRLDGRDIRTMPVTELRSHLGVVPQESVLFSGTVLENLMEAVPGASFGQVVEACKLAGIHETIEAMANGYQTVIGERGTGLSGGQRQRLAIARALLRLPKVLIFDESTSGLDEVSAEHVAEAVNRLKSKVAVLFIAHKVPKGLIVTKHLSLGGPRTEASSR
jgi:ATP-binding cassette, subfamily B, bacterial HlyB/CyaB